MATSNSDAFIDGITKRVQSVAQRVIKEAADATIKEVLPDLASELESEYVQDTAKWYAAYAPRKYSRNYSIFDLLDVEVNGRSVDWRFEEGRMTSASNGGSLWGRVFHGGSHGLPHRSFVPVVSTPVPNMFDDSIKMLEKKYSDIWSERTKAEFYRRFPSAYYGG